ncbi:MAG: filamentous hemagglutinin N-terminal domain-containing protein [Potamolinea sp.]
MTPLKNCEWHFGLAGFLVVVGAIAIAASPSFAQIKPDDTLGGQSSVITPNTKVDNLNADQINGGAIRGVNLFHSFSEFNVGNGQRVYFASPTGIENILSRVTGNNPSNILGVLGVNGPANLFFINPNGIVFGQNAQLDIKASFFATTANSLVFGNNLKFSATHPEAPPLLTIKLRPGLQYGSNQSAVISNAGSLLVGQNLTLAAGNLNLQGQIKAGRDLTLQAQNTVQILDSTTKPFIAKAGRNLLVQGNQGVDISALNHPNSGLWAGRNLILRSANTVRGDAHYSAAGNFRIEKLDGSLGNLFSPEDPIIRARGDVSFSEYTGASLHIFAGGSVNIRSVTITGADAINYIDETVTLSDGATLNINGSTRPTLDVRAGTTAFSPVGIRGSNYIKLSPIPSTTNSATNSNINIGRITVTAPNGSVYLTNQYQPNIALPGGTIQVRSINTSSILGNGGDVVIDSRSGIFLNGDVNSGSIDSFSNGGKITLIANDKITTDEIDTSSRFWDGGEISITSRNGGIDTSAGSLLSFADLSGRNGGKITLNAKSEITAGDINSSGGKLGGGGDINITSKGKVSANNSLIQSDTYGQGKGGNIRIAAESVSFSNGAQLSASNSGVGNKAGSVSINATDSVSFDGVNSKGQSSGAFSRVNLGAEGDGGEINISARSLWITNSAQISATTFGKGDAGNVNIVATDTVSFDGGYISNQYPSTVASRVAPEAEGNGGNINITARSLSVSNGALLTATTLGKGNAGNVNIVAKDTVSFDGWDITNKNPTTVSSRVALGAQGDGGNLNITARSLFVSNGALLSASISGKGDAGNVNITATDTVSFDGTNSKGNPSVAVSRVNLGAQGNGRDINIKARSLTITNGAQLSVNSIGKGSAGNIMLTADFIFLDNQGRLTAETASGNGGNITLQGQGVLLLRNNSLISTTAGTLRAGGNGGNIRIDTDLIVAIPKENSDIKANAFQGRGGNISIATQGIFGIEPRTKLTPKSDITASSEFGVNGVVAINTPEADPTRSLTTLPTDIVDITGLIDRRCEVGSNSANSTFTITGRGGLPPNPYETLGEESWLQDLGSPIAARNGEKARRQIADKSINKASAKQIIEAQGWIIGADGNIILTAQSSSATPQKPWIVPVPCQ